MERFSEFSIPNDILLLGFIVALIVTFLFGGIFALTKKEKLKRTDLLLIFIFSLVATWAGGIWLVLTFRLYGESSVFNIF